MLTSLSLDHGGPANALGASLGRGLSSLTNGGRFGNDSVKHVVTTQGFGATVNIEDLVTVVKSLVTTTSPDGMECGGANSDIVKIKSWPISRTRLSDTCLGTFEFTSQWGKNACAVATQVGILM